MNLKKTMGDY